MALKIFKVIFLAIVIVITVFFVSIISKQTFLIGHNLPNIATSTPVSGSNQTSNAETIKKAPEESGNAIKAIKPQSKSVSSSAPAEEPKTTEIAATSEVSSKSFEELVNSSVIQLYCGNLNSEKTDFSDITRGTGIIIDSGGDILTNRHIIYDENSKKLRPDCFVLKSPFPNSSSQKPKIYYMASIISYPLKEEFNDSFSKDKYYNDFAILKIFSKPDANSKINLLLGFDYALPEDYLVLESGPNKYNYLPIDWNYQPQNDDILITLGYGVDASHNANQITSTIGNLAGNINIDNNNNPEIILVESNATAGFSGGALINPKSKGLVGLISWITSGDETGKYTVTIFRDFLRVLMIKDLTLDLKLMQSQ